MKGCAEKHLLSGLSLVVPPLNAPLRTEGRSADTLRKIDLPIFNLFAPYMKQISHLSENKEKVKIIRQEMTRMLVLVSHKLVKPI